MGRIEGQQWMAHRPTQATANPSISGFPKTLPTHRLRRVQSATSFYADFRPLFRLGGLWCRGIPCETVRVGE
jgi:hypothetical protein